jgi:hypothetical protein
LAAEAAAKGPPWPSICCPPELGREKLPNQKVHSTVRRHRCASGRVERTAVLRANGIGDFIAWRNAIRYEA